GCIEVEVVELEPAAGVTESVGIDVHEREGTAMHAGEHERRTRDDPLDTQPGTDALRETGLARPERTAEHDQITGRELRSQPPAQGVCLLGALEAQGQRSR